MTSRPKTSISFVFGKRQRMMDMMLVLGGLKEEAAVPLSKVNEEISKLKQEIEPLTAEILEFPERYFQAFFDTAKKAGLGNSLSDRGVLTESIGNLESALSNGDSSALTGLLEVLKTRLDSMSEKEDASQDSSVGDVSAILKPVVGLISNIQASINSFEEKAKADEEEAMKELESLTDSFASLTLDLNSDPDASLAELQKLGTNTRYGPFLRIAAQLKRGKRDGRIDDARFGDLIRTNLLLELRRGIIMFVLGKMGSKTAVQLGESMGISPKDVQNAIVSMIGRGEVEMVGLDGDAPVFAQVLTKTPDTTLVVKRIVQQLRGIVKTLDESSKSTVQEPLEQLEGVLERLQLLGAYDEPALSEPITNLREVVEKATEAAIGSGSSEDSKELRLLVSAGLEAFTRFRLKITLEKGPNLVSGLNVYGEQLDPEKYKQIMDNYLDSELERGTLLILIREIGAMTAKDLAEKSRIPQDRILQHLLRMKRDELLTIAGEDHGYVLYDVPRTLNEAEIAIQTACNLASLTAQAKTELQEILSDLRPDTIGRLTGALEIFSRSRDKMETITIDGTVVGNDILSSVEETIKSSVSMGYRTRARLPSTRPKVTIDDLLDVDVPSVLEEYRGMMGYAPLLGFGTIEWDYAKCVGCKSCEIACPEDAIELKPVIDIPKFFELTNEEIEKQLVNKGMFYKTVRSLATTKPTSQIKLGEEKPGFGTVEVDLWLCVGCRTCVRRCPGTEGGALELDLKWNLPEVVRHLVSPN
ncbi:MAG: 4Fe-4S dicluster domain-containing protein [Candidatus Thorarchaeota archaeon]|nr:4Fe-4S dicluster domain-containing protein [Candidatus Thorarchaeota archaeon]